MDVDGRQTGSASPAGDEERHRTEDVRERQAPSARIVHDAIRREGREELARPAGALAWSGLASGLSMGFSLLAEGLLHAHLPEAGWRPLVSSWGYALGFLIVVLGRQQLFTENTLTPMLPLLHTRTSEMLWRVLRLWGIVLGTNLLGTLAFAAALGNTALFSADVNDAFEQIGRGALEHSWGTTLVGAIFAGWLVALMVWLLPYAETARVWIVLIMAFVIGLGGFAHIIAGSTEVFYLVLTGTTSWTTYWGQFFAPALLGNIVGGVALVALLNHGQVVAGGESD